MPSPGAHGSSTPTSLAFVGVTCVLASLGACGPSLPGPPTVAAPDAAFEEVPFPPPPARPEEIPSAPSTTTVWVDGHWRWARGQWFWERGGWYEVPEGVRYAPTALRWRPDGTPEVAAGHWRRDGRQVDPPPRAATAKPRGGAVVDETGTPVETRTPRHRGGGRGRRGKR